MHNVEVVVLCYVIFFIPYRNTSLDGELSEFCDIREMLVGL